LLECAACKRDRLSPARRTSATEGATPPVT
jgi:hypothetical protein